VRGWLVPRTGPSRPHESLAASWRMTAYGRWLGARRRDNPRAAGATCIALTSGEGEAHDGIADGLPVRDLRSETAVVQFVREGRQGDSAAGDASGELRRQAPVHTGRIGLGQVRAEQRERMHDDDVALADAEDRVRARLMHEQEVHVSHREGRSVLPSTLIDYILRHRALASQPGFLLSCDTQVGSSSMNPARLLVLPLVLARSSASRSARRRGRDGLR
jgi:hypothetical protein